MVSMLGNAGRAAVLDLVILGYTLGETALVNEGQGVQVWVSIPDIVVLEMVQNSVLVEEVDMVIWVKQTETLEWVSRLTAIKRAMKMEVGMLTERWLEIALIEKREKGLA